MLNQVVSKTLTRPVAPTLVGMEPRDAVIAARQEAGSRLPDREEPEGQFQDGQEDRHPDQG